MNQQSASKMERLCKTMVVDFAEGNLQISCSLSSNGGSIRMILLNGIDKKDMGDIQFGKVMGMPGYNFSILIEPSNIKVIEPCSRNSQYYLPYRLSELNYKSIRNFNVRYLKEIKSCRDSRKLQQFKYDSFLDYVTFDTVIKTNNIDKFFKSILSELELGGDISDFVINQINSFLSCCNKK